MQQALQADKRNKYSQSEAFLHRAEQVIPLGSQTFSKSRVHFPLGVSPFFAARGEGAYLWDIDGNRYVDYLCGLLSVSLGYCDPDVDQAVKQQLSKGVTFSLPHRLETELAERLVALIPCAEKVRFGKNGSDATSAAVRLARAYTHRDHVVVCGYHGWQDWYIGTTSRDLGVPESSKRLSHVFYYNDIASLSTLFDQYPEDIAAVIMEPMATEYPQQGFLAQVRDLSHRHGALLIFDEMITGFRFALGGAQSYFNVVPDLATFGKGMANGYPLSAIVGRADIMSLMEDIFFSATFGGETLSLAAAIATIDKIQHQSVIEHLAVQGEKIITALKTLIDTTRSDDLIDINGHPAWTLIDLHGNDAATALEIKTLFMQEMLARGILMQSTHNLTFSHNNEAINTLLRVYGEVLPMLVEAIRMGSVQKLLKAEPLEPLFTVR